MREMYPKNGSVILHVDMNCFFASVEIAHDPSLQGKPLAVAGNEKERKGIIITCSYEARNTEYVRRCPFGKRKGYARN